MSGFAFTFDDGPDPVWTPRLLDLLDLLDVKATFFPIASKVAAHPGLMRRARDAGHAVGLHCHEHVRHSARDRGWLEHDTRVALDLLAEVGVKPRLWRTPWGDTTAFSREVARQYDLRIVGWTVDTHDWRGDTAEQMFDATSESLCPGAVVLAHDGLGPGARRADAAETLGYVERVARWATRIGLKWELLD